MYPILRESLQNYSCHVTLVDHILKYLNHILETATSVEQLNLVKFHIKSYGLYSELQKLYEHKNKQVQHKCEYLLTAIATDFYKLKH